MKMIDIGLHILASGAMFEAAKTASSQELMVLYVLLGTYFLLGVARL